MLKKNERTEIYWANTKRAKITKFISDCIEFKALHRTKSFIPQWSIISSAAVTHLWGPDSHLNCLISSKRHTQITVAPLKEWFAVESLKVTNNIISRSHWLSKTWTQVWYVRKAASDWWKRNIRVETQGSALVQQSGDWGISSGPPPVLWWPGIQTLHSPHYGLNIPPEVHRL